MIKILLTISILLAHLPAYAKLDNDTCLRDLESVEVLRKEDQYLRQAFIDEFAELVLADERQNQTWIDDALASLSRNDIHILIENSWMKKLNDKILKNKDFVTALTNYQKVLFLEEFGKRMIALKHSPYQDFKTTRLTLTAPVADAVLLELEAAFTAANERFYSSPRLNAIMRESDLRENWFRMGIGQNETQAGLAARDARDHGGPKGISYYWDKQVHARFQSQFERVKTMHEQVIERLGAGSKLLVQERGWVSLHIDVFTAARKSTAKDFTQTLEQLFPGRKIKQSIAKLILDYCQAADEFSPSVLVAKREHLTVHDAPFGAISMDFIGLGAENLRGTVKALVRAKTLDEAVRLTRVSEREVTKVFEKRKAIVKSAIEKFFGGQVSMRFSGDDGIIIPEREITLRDQLLLMQALSQLLPRPYFRMAVINAEGANTENSSQLITHGESVEKALRQILLRDLGGQRLAEISFNTFIPDTGVLRKVNLIMSGKKKLTDAEKKIIRRSFVVAVKLIESQVQAQGLNIEYDPTEIFAIFGKTR